MQGIKPPVNVAFFDSGQGGLTVWEAVVKRYPNLNTTYLGDNARHPYGNKSAETVTRYTAEALFYLIQQNAGFVVVACGTASSVAVEEMKHIFRVPVIGVVEGLCLEAARLTLPTDTIAVLGTRFTIKSESYVRGLKAGGRNNVWSSACPLFVPLVEEGVTPGPMAEEAAALYLKDIPNNVKVVILGCTHYPRLAQSIANVLCRLVSRPVVYRSADGEQQLAGAEHNGKDPVILLDSFVGVLNEVSHFLGQQNESVYQTNEHRFYCSDAPQRFAEVAKVFTNQSLPDIQLVRLGA